MIHTYTISCLNLEQIALSGQCFRMLAEAAPQEATRESGKQIYEVISGSHALRIWQEGEQVSFDCAQDDLPMWLDYFDCETDYPAMIASIDPGDAYLREAARCGSGIRILRQEPWEMIITFVISQQKTIPKIREAVEALAKAYGSALENSGRYAFPTPSQLSQASLDDLLALKLGYRAKYIHRLCHDAVSGALDLTALSQMDYAKAMDYLTGFYGIGKKVANCVCLFGLHHIDAFPVDTWIEKILMEHYYNPRKYRRTPKAQLNDKIIAACFGRYGGYAGVMQQYIFYYERLRSQKLA